MLIKWKTCVDTCLSESTALTASSLEEATMTPFPAAKPLAFTTKALYGALKKKIVFKDASKIYQTQNSAKHSDLMPFENNMPF